MYILDTIMIICWAIVYILILWNGGFLRAEARLMIPLIACTCNLSWEVNAMIRSHGNWGHVLWFFLDAAVFLLCLIFIYRKAEKPVVYCIAYLGLTILCMQITYDVFQFDEGMMVSSFVINLIMSLMFLVFEKQISENGKIPIAVMKLLGTLCATLGVGQKSIFLTVIGTVIFLLDLFYVALCMEEKAVRKYKRGKFE